MIAGADVAIAVHSLVRHKLRSLLTLLGMVFGVGAVVAMLSIGEGARREAERVALRLGIDNLIVGSAQLSAEQLERVRNHSLGLRVEDIAAARQALGFVVAGEGEKSVPVYDLHSDFGAGRAEVVGVTRGWPALANLRVTHGRFWSAQEADAGAALAVLGSGAAHDLFGDRDPVGELVKVNHAWFTVVGVVDAPALKRTELQGVAIADDRQRVFLPLETAWLRLRFEPMDSQLDSIRLTIARTIDTRTAAVALAEFFKARHGRQDDTVITVPAALLETQERTQRIFTLVLACIAGISLLVGGIGIMNVMLASVVERTQEIGLMRAVGARMGDVSRQFLIEGGLLSVAGGLAGVGLGVAIAALVQRFAGWPIAFSPATGATALGVCLAVGVGFCIYPALQAARMDPIAALRKEGA